LLRQALLQDRASQDDRDANIHQMKGGSDMDDRIPSYAISKHAIHFTGMPQRDPQHCWPQMPHIQPIKLTPKTRATSGKRLDARTQGQGVMAYNVDLSVFQLYNKPRV
jgi:hypothetical protein